MTSPALDHRCISASAGSGKTYQLATRFAHLVLEGAEPTSILATTFTRLAAGEIRNRVLRRFIDALRDDDKLGDLARATGISNLDQKKVRDALVRMTRALPSLQIRTLDSFFASVVGAQTLELGLPPDVQQIETDEEQALSLEALRRVFLQTEHSDAIEMLRAFTLGKTDVALGEMLQKDLDDIRGMCADAADDGWFLPAPPSAPSRVALNGAIGVIENAADDTGVAIQKFCRKFLAMIGQGAWLDIAIENNVRNVDAGINKCSGANISDDFADAIGIIGQAARHHGMIMLNERAKTLRALIKAIEHERTALKRERGVMSYADITVAMADVNNADAMESVWYRLDASLHHLLLDEFQDTSLRQWHAIWPLVKELLSVAAPDRTVFCVGDVKQAIYGWRQEVPDLLPHMPRSLGGDKPCMTEESLAKSYRSAPAIMEFVNLVFGRLRDWDSIAAQDDTVARWLSSFQTHETEHIDMAGYVRVVTAPQGKDATMQTAADRIMALHARWPHATIGVLARSNKQVRSLAEALQDRNLPAAGFDRSNLTDVAPVNAILSLLHLAGHPDDTVAAFHVAHSPLGEVLGIEQTIAQRSERHARNACARNVRRDVQDMGFGPVIAAWTKALRDSCDESMRRRLMQLVELAERFDARGGGSVREFVQRAEAAEVDALNDAPIRVMTINASKGLEFDFVVLPTLDSRLIPDLSKTKVCAARDEPIGPPTQLCPTLNQKQRAAFDAFEPLHEAQIAAGLRDALCIFYVALTRAKIGMELITPAPKIKKKEGTLYKEHGVSMAGCIWHAIDQPIPDEDSTLMIIGDVDAGPEPVAHAPCAPALRGIPIVAGGSRALSGRAAAAPSHGHGRSRLFDGIGVATDDEPRCRGLVMHRLFEEVRWIDSLAEDIGDPIDRSRLISLARIEVPDRDEHWHAAIVDQWIALLETDAVRTALSRPADDALVRMEMPFARRVGGGVQRGIIDRLVIRRGEDGRPVSARIWDWKTDETGDEAATTLRQRHEGQMRGYIEAVAELLSLPAGSVAATLVGLAADVLVEVEPAAN